MEYLLRHCSIFVPNGRSIKEFIQVTGTPLTSLDLTKPSHALSAPPHVLVHLQSGCTQTLSNVNTSFILIFFHVIIYLHLFFHDTFI
jgi:hypothetical protein